MPGDVGLVAQLVNTFARFFMDEDGYAELRKRRLLKAKKEECRRALLDHRFDDLKRLVDELERLSSSP